jgi:hypothetical protein
MTVADFTTPDLMIPRLRGKDMPAVLQELSQPVQLYGRVRESLPFCQAFRFH